MIDNKLYTWIDIQDWLESYFNLSNNSYWLENVNFRAYWDGLTINFAKPKTKEQIIEKLKEIFSIRLLENNETILFEGELKFPIFFEEVEPQDIDKSVFKPTLGRKPFIAQKDINQNKPKELTSTFFAFHSFKGGVGRTLHAIAMALHLVEKNHKVLLIDADFEAPGITWLLNQTTISFADILAMIHGDNNHDEIIKIISSEILNGNDEENGNLYILPAFRNLKNGNIPNLEIKPENIYKFSEEPFLLTDILDKLAKELGVDYVILDLRAGVSELSSGWFFDPRINKIFVTTLSSQSLLGTTKMFDILSQFDAQNQIKDENMPFLIISQIPKESLQTEQTNWENIDSSINSNLINLRSKYIESFVEMGSENLSGLTEDEKREEVISRVVPPYTFFSVENDNLKSLPDTWEEVSKLIKMNELQKEMMKISNVSTTNNNKIGEAENFEEGRKKLVEATSKLIFAESFELKEFLVTKSIKNLMTNFRKQIPIVVIVGAKGSGKTFLFKQIWLARNWKEFIAKEYENNENDATILPITIPQTGFNNLVRLPSDIKEITGYNKEDNIWIDFIKRDIEKTLQNNLTISEWRDKWLDYISWAAGYRVNETGVGSSFIDLLKTKKQKIVAIFDGLEELFSKFNSSVEEQKAVSSLLKDVPNWLDLQAEKYLGIVVFVRKDIVLATITQNSGQFLSQYENYELKWNIEEALRLVHWVLNQFDIFKNKDIPNEDLKDKTFEELKNPLYKLWGKRMASDNSNEAYSHNWILGSLANLKKEIQSRDIMRFLEFASEESISTTDSRIIDLYQDRLFFPSAIRSSVGKVGSDKISEVKKENEPLKIILEQLESNITSIKFPCKPDEIKSILSEEKIKVLEDNGVIILHKLEYYMAPIYQQGMGFDYSRKGKPKVLYF